jgi:hypothetical protein
MKQSIFLDCVVNLKELVTILPFSSVFSILKGETKVFLDDEVSYSSLLVEFEVGVPSFFLAFTL